MKRKQKARRKIETKCSQKVSEGKEKAILEVEVHRSPVHVESFEERRTEKTGTKRMTRESSVKQTLVFVEHRDKLLRLNDLKKCLGKIFPLSIGAEDANDYRSHVKSTVLPLKSKNP